MQEQAVDPYEYGRSETLVRNYFGMRTSLFCMLVNFGVPYNFGTICMLVCEMFQNHVSKITM